MHTTHSSLVYDFDGDGTEQNLPAKPPTEPLTAKAKFIGDKDADWRLKAGETLDGINKPGETGKRNAEGYVVKGPEYLTVFNGETGAEMTTTKYVPSRHPDTENPSSVNNLKPFGAMATAIGLIRFLAAVAYLDGVHPSLIFARGYYTKTVLAAWDFRDGKLTQRWVFDSRFKRRKQKIRRARQS